MQPGSGQGNRTCSRAGGGSEAMENDGFGWKLFAGIMVLVAGTFNLIDGLVGLTNASALETTRVTSQLPLTNNVKTYSWFILVVGAVMILAGFLIFVGNMFGRIVGVAAASVNAVLQLAYLGHYPFWSFTIILVDILVIWGLVVHGGSWQDDQVD
jgi:hypothetical protein